MTQFPSANNSVVGQIRTLRISEPAWAEPVEIVNGIFWIRLPLAGTRDSVNVYLLLDGEHSVLIDTGCNTLECRAAIESLLHSELLLRRPIAYVIGTHYHPDHVGLAGFFSQQPIPFYTTRTCWLYGHLLQQDGRELPSDEQIEFMQRAGLTGIEMAAYRRRSPSNYSNLVLPFPKTYVRLVEGQVLTIGDRKWTIRLGNGHAADHVTLWSDDELVVVGDQVLAGIASNLNVHYSEPTADVVREWLESCQRFAELATDAMLCLPGHGKPFHGMVTRCNQLIDSCQRILARLVNALDRPHTAVECLELIYRRPLRPTEQNLLIGETVGYLNHLVQQGLVARTLSPNGVCYWQRQSNKNAT